MRTKILKLIAVLSMVLLAFNGCKKDEGEEPNPTPEPPAPKIETKVSDDVVMIIPKEGKKIEDYIVSYTTDEIVLEFPDNSTNRSAENSTELIQTFNGNKLTDLKEGQIISIPPNDKVKTGTLKKVSSITKERIKNKIKIKMAVSQPNLVEVFKNGLDEDHTFNFFQLFSGGKAEVEVPKDKWGLKFSAELDASKNKFSIIGEGDLNFWVNGKKTDSKFKTLIGVELSNLKINLHLKHKPNAKGPQFAKLSLSGEIATYMDAELNIKFKKNFDSDPFLLGRIKLPPTPIGSTPLYIQPILELTMKRGLSGVLEVSARLFEFTHPFLYAVGYDENKSNKWFIETGKEKVKFTNIADNFTDNLNIDGKVELKDNFEILLHYAFMDWKGAEFYVGGGVENKLQFKYKGSEKKISLKDDISLYLLGGMDFYILYETLGLRKEYRLDIKSWNLYEKDFDFNKEAKRLILSADTLNLRKGESSIVKITSGNGKYEVDSDNKNIVLASLNEKNEVVINSIAVGIATVTVVDNISKAKKEIKVTVTEADNNLVLSANSITLKEGEHKVVNITSGSGVYIVKSNNESVVLANEVKAGVIGIIAKGAGNATVIVKDKATKQQKTIEVTVTKETKENNYNIPEEVIIENGVLKKWPDSAVPEDGHITIPNGVTRIDNRVFWNNKKLKTISMPNTLTSIGLGAFSGCHSLQSLTIPNSVTSIEEEAFYSCISLKTVTIPSSITIIERKVFETCTALVSVNIPNTVTNIKYKAFHYCPSLVSVTIPSSVKMIEEDAFGSCSKLSTVISKSPSPTNIKNFGYSGKLIVPNGTKELYQQATGWKNCSPIVEEENKKVDINEGLIAYYPFNGNANDYSGNGNNGTVYGAQLTSDKNGKHNAAYTFDGVNDFIKVPTSTSLENFDKEITISAWININKWFNSGSVGYFPILEKSDESSIGGLMNLHINTSTGIQSIYRGNIAYNNYKIPLNQWVYVSFVCKNNTAYFYIDGNLIGKKQMNGNYSYKKNSPLIIGKDIPGLVEYANGKIDDIRIYNRALSDSEINFLYQNSL